MDASLLLRLCHTPTPAIGLQWAIVNDGVPPPDLEVVDGHRHCDTAQGSLGLGVIRGDLSNDWRHNVRNTGLFSTYGSILVWNDIIPRVTNDPSFALGSQTQQTQLSH